MLYMHFNEPVPKGEKNIINIDDNEYSKSLLDELNEIVSISNEDNSDNIDKPIEEHQEFTLKSMGKKDKKKKKKKNKVSDEFADFIDLEPDVLEVTGKDGIVREVIMNKPKVDIESYYLKDDEDDNEFVDKIVDPNRKAYQKLKKDKNKFKREVAEELTLLYDTLKETDRFSKKILRRYDEIDSSKQRGLSKYTIDLAGAVLTSKQTKLNIIKEISNIKKNALDQKMKYEERIAKMELEMAKANNQQATNTDLGLMGSGYLQSIIQHGRKNFVENMRDGVEYQSDDEDDGYMDGIQDDNGVLLVEEDDNPFEELRQQVSDEYEDELDDAINRRLNSSGRTRSIAGDKYIQYEHREPTIKISLDSETGDYSFFAVDKDGDIIDDYPLPEQDHRLNPITFSIDNQYGTDKRGRQYKTVIY